MAVHRIDMRPVRIGAGGYRYDLHHDGVLVVAKSRVPLCDAARWCCGTGKDGIVEVWRYGGSAPAMSGKIERYASLTVSETDTLSPRFVKWHPFNAEVRKHEVTA